MRCVVGSEGKGRVMATGQRLFCVAPGARRRSTKSPDGPCTRCRAPQITFESPVVLTTARVGAAPSAAAGQHQAAHVLLFAQDASAPASARFLQLCPGLEQPESGTRAVQLQVT